MQIFLTTDFEMQGLADGIVSFSPIGSCYLDLYFNALILQQKTFNLVNDFNQYPDYLSRLSRAFLRFFKTTVPEAALGAHLVWQRRLLCHGKLIYIIREAFS